MSGAVILPRLILRPLVCSDAAAVAGALANVNVTRWLTGAPRDYTLNDARAFVSRASGDPGYFAICRRGSLIGVISHGAEQGLGYWLAEPYWGRGYISEVLPAMIGRVFAGGVQAIKSGYIPGNTASRRALQACGFHRGEDESVPVAGAAEPAVVRRMWLSRADWDFARNPHILTARLRLAPIAPEHAKDAAEGANDPDVARMTATIPHPFDSAQALAWMGDNRWSGRPGFRWGVWLKDGPLVGMVMIGGHPASVGYWIARAHWGRGYATEAMRAFLADVLARLDLKQVTAEAFVDNPASHRVLEKLGFTRTGEAVGNSLARVEPAPVLTYRLNAQTLGGMP
ncbi:GNAT family N-acetyltransferase [Oceanibium sediminis]|uniref:GNAT family N-acetyltransferase n=1 Tax=Oceanibium sediminis TaxID=2026339 RepID=UPI000DD37699|nr:GNAT family N-acetyltransferase [Oceanibium sediminis]